MATPAELAKLLHAYLDAKAALTDANAGEERKLGVVHRGQVFMIQLGKDGIQGMAFGPWSEDPEGHA